MKFLLISQDGDLVPVIHPEGTRTLPTIQALVDGFIDYVRTPAGFDAWVNDEGLFREDFRPNRIGVRITGQVLVGPIVLASSTEDGRTVGLADDEMTAIADHLGRDLAPAVTVEEAVARYVRVAV